VQWYNILQQAAGAAPSRQAVEDLYLHFCQDMREGNPTRYPQVRGRHVVSGAEKSPLGTPRQDSQSAVQEVGWWFGVMTCAHPSPLQIVRQTDLAICHACMKIYLSEAPASFQGAFPGQFSMFLNCQLSASNTYLRLLEPLMESIWQKSNKGKEQVEVRVLQWTVGWWYLH